ncbi:hypothetical protein VKT23_016983 [Stygiomarasmius scandens]|uniref:Uncharacterized protein n=1 Tax=Marasmiellus scandens TaxID=2682957 RepID=A0ABR1ITJ9_9AGAR
MANSSCPSSAAISDGIKRPESYDECQTLAFQHLAKAEHYFRTMEECHGDMMNPQLKQLARIIMAGVPCTNDASIPHYLLQVSNRLNELYSTPPSITELVNSHDSAPAAATLTITSGDDHTTAEQVEQVLQSGGIDSDLTPETPFSIILNQLCPETLRRSFKISFQPSDGHRGRIIERTADGKVYYMDLSADGEMIPPVEGNSHSEDLPDDSVSESLQASEHSQPSESGPSPPFSSSAHLTVDPTATSDVLYASSGAESGSPSSQDNIPPSAPVPSSPVPSIPDAAVTLPVTAPSETSSADSLASEQIISAHSSSISSSLVGASLPNVSSPRQSPVSSACPSSFYLEPSGSNPNPHSHISRSGRFLFTCDRTGREYAIDLGKERFSLPNWRPGPGAKIDRYPPESREAFIAHLAVQALCDGVDPHDESSFMEWFECYHWETTGEGDPPASLLEGTPTLPSAEEDQSDTEPRPVRLPLCRQGAFEGRDHPEVYWDELEWGPRPKKTIKRTPAGPAIIDTQSAVFWGLIQPPSVSQPSVPDTTSSSSITNVHLISPASAATSSSVGHRNLRTRRAGFGGLGLPASVSQTFIPPTASSTSTTTTSSTSSSPEAGPSTSTTASSSNEPHNGGRRTGFGGYGLPASVSFAFIPPTASSSTAAVSTSTSAVSSAVASTSAVLTAISSSSGHISPSSNGSAHGEETSDSDEESDSQSSSSPSSRGAKRARSDIDEDEDIGTDSDVERPRQRRRSSH